MDDVILRKLLQTNKPAEKATITAEYFFGQLSVETARAARQCIILHWFDYSIVEALLQETALTSAEKENIYKQLISLPFTETLPWGQRFQVLTREGLLSQYMLTQPDLLREAARLSAPAYASHIDDKMNVAESLFCHIIAGNRSVSISLLDELIERAKSSEDWTYVSELLRLQDEAERFPFVLPLPRTEQHWILRGLVYSTQGKLEDALVDYGKAILINPKSAAAFIGRGKVFTKQQKYKRALADYNYALKLDPTNIHIYANRSALFTKQGHYTDALRDLDQSLQIEPDNPFVLCNKGTVLSELEQFEQALIVYNKILHLFPTMIEAHIGKGETLFSLQRYAESLAAYKEALQLSPYLAGAHRGKGNALFALKHYGEAQLAYDEAKQLEFFTASVDDEEVEPISPHKSAQQPPTAQESVKDNSPTDDARAQRRVTTSSNPVTLLDRMRRVHRSQRQPKRRKTNQLGYYLGRVASLAAVAVIIVAALLLFHTSPTSIGSNVNATSTAQAQFEASATAGAKLTPSPTSEITRLRILLQVDYQGLLNNSPAAITDLKQKITNQIIREGLQGRHVGLTFVYSGAPDDSQIAQALEIATRVYHVLQTLGNTSVFQSSSYYDPLYILGNPPSIVTIDAFLLPTSNQLSPTPVSSRLEFTYHRITLQVDPQGLLNGSPSAINHLKQEIRSQSILKGRQVGLAIVIAGTPSDSGIAQAQSVVQKVNDVLKTLGQENFAFQRAAYYDPLYLLGGSPTEVVMDIFLFA